jgi:tetratricopeptide (TPR) repeat protein
MLARAEALIDIGRSDDAVTWLQRAIGAEPHNTDAHCLQALALLRLGDHAQALQAAQQAVLTDPTHEWPHRLRSVILLQLGHKREALEAAREAARLGPSVLEALFTLARAELASGRTRDAQATVERLVASAPERDLAHVMRGNVAIEQKAWRAAEEHYRRALVINPQHWEAMNNLGVALQGQGREQEAIACFHHAARIDPTSHLIQNNLLNAVKRHLGETGNVTGWRRVALVFLYVVALTASIGAGAPMIAIGLVGSRIINRRQRRRKLQALPPAVVAFYESQKKPRRLGKCAIVIAVACILLLLLLVFAGH